MLHYREYPFRIATKLLLFAFPLAYGMYIVIGLLTGTLFTLSLLEHQGLLGLGALTVVFTLPLMGIIADRLRRLDTLLLLVSIIPPFIGFLSITPFIEIEISTMQLVTVLSAFSGLAALLLLWTLRIGQCIVVRYRGRTSALFLCLAIGFVSIYRIIDQEIIISIEYTGILIPSVLGMVAILILGALRPWKEPHVALAVSGNMIRYFLPTVLILAAHILWYNVTKLELQDYFTSDPAFESLSQFVNLGLFELVILCIGIASAGFMADYRDRKTTFSFLLLLMGLLTIFGSALYNAYFLNPGLTFLLTSLLGAERFIEGFLIGVCLPLIWSELGSVRTKGLRLSLVWFFFLGYVTLFWAVDLESTVFGLHFHFPDVLFAIGGQFAILSTLIALYLIGPLPTILGRELEVEELDLDFDEKQVKKTVDAFVGTDDFDSIKSQIDIIDAGSEISDSDMSDILGEDFKTKPSLRSIPGVGEALEKKLHAAGYDSATQLAGETAQRLTQKIDGLNIARAEKLLKDARDLVKKEMKNNKK